MSSNTSPVVQAFQGLEQHLCRIGNRTSLFRVGDSDLRDKGHDALAGRVIYEAREYLHNQKLKIPTQRQMADHISVGVNPLGELLNGKPSGRTKWCQECNKLLAFLLQETLQLNSAGVAPDARTLIDEIQNRIRHYFFRLPQGATIPSFFEFRRRFFGVPCSVQELSQEIAWFARQPDVGSFRTEITFVLGGAPFPTYDPNVYLKPTIQAALANGVEVTFVLPKVGIYMHDDAVVTNLQNDYPKARFLKMTSDGVYAWNDDSQLVGGPPREACLCLPWGHLLHMHSVSHLLKEKKDEKVDCVFLNLRYFTPTFTPGDHEPVASPATKAGEDAFNTWRSKWEQPMESLPQARDSVHNSTSKVQDGPDESSGGEIMATSNGESTNS